MAKVGTITIMPFRVLRAMVITGGSSILPGSQYFLEWIGLATHVVLSPQIFAAGKKERQRP